jgi:hypothetical protein
MKIILQKEVDKLGVPGDVVTVADGYARNYLVPRGMAIVATKSPSATPSPSAAPTMSGSTRRRPPRRSSPRVSPRSRSS